MANKIKLNPEQMKQFNYLMRDLDESIANLVGAKHFSDELAACSFSFPVFQFFNYNALSISATVKRVKLTKKALSGIFGPD